MFSRIVLISFLLLGAVVTPLSAQAIPLPPAALGVPYSFDLGEGLNAIPPIPGLDFSFSFSVAAGSLPPGISLTQSGLFSGTPTATGDFPFTIDFHFHLAYLGQVYDLDVPFPVSLTVTGTSGVAVTVAPAALTFNFVQGASAPSTQSLAISNRSQTPLTFSASPSANWLSVSPASGAAGPFSATTLAVTANPSGLAPGIYTGSVSVSVAPTGDNLNVFVTATVSGGQAELALSQSGERFQAVAGGASPASQSIAVLSGSGGAINWTASASTTSGGSSWLSVAPTSGRSTSSSSTSTKVSVNPAGLQPGDYYGLVQFSADGAANSPQSAQVVFSVLAADAALPAAVQPTGAIFVGVTGGANPAARTVTISNPSNRALTFSTAIFFTNGSNWFTVQPAGGAVAAGQTASFDIQPAINALPVGIYRGEVTLHFIEDNSIRHIAVLAVVVGSPPTGGAPQANAPGPQAGCTPTQLLPVSTQLGAGFATPASWPVALEALVVDDCGNLMTSGSVVTSFSSGDASLVLTSLNDGRWSGTWVPRQVVAQVTVTVTAQQTQPAIQGTVQIGGSSQANPTVPVINSGGALSAVSYIPNQPLAPGTYAAIFGAHLSQGITVAPVLPLTNKLGGAQVFLGGRQLPISYTRDDVILAIVPYDVPVNTTQQIVIQQGSSLSSPERVNIASAQPALNQYGAGVGAITDAQNALVTPANPAHVGDAIVIYCAGLGAVDPPVPAGVAAPLKLSNTVNPVSVNIGGQTALVLFAGLSPGSAGLYQVNVYVPTGVTADPNVPVTITVAGQQSNTVTLAVAK